jgi:hypothetical protein
MGQTDAKVQFGKIMSLEMTKKGPSEFLMMKIRKSARSGRVGARSSPRGRLYGTGST